MKKKKSKFLKMLATNKITFHAYGDSKGDKYMLENQIFRTIKVLKMKFRIFQNFP